MAGKSEAERENFLLERAEKGRGLPEAPEPLVILSRLRSYNTQYYEGGLSNQPHILLMEMDQVVRAEQEMEAIMRANAKIAAQKSQ